jgi:hypothetical protein
MASTATTGRRLLLGDWGRIIRDPLDVLRLTYVIAAVAYVSVTGEGTVNLAASSLAVLGARFVDLPQPYDLAFIGAMTLTGWGDALGLYERFPNYDSVVHFLVPSTMAPIVYILLARAEVLPRLRGALWEIFEWTSDHLFGSSLVRGESDTVGDLVADGCGAAAGGVLLLLWSVFGWASERRLPGGEQAFTQQKGQEA